MYLSEQKRPEVDGNVRVTTSTHDAHLTLYTISYEIDQNNSLAMR